MSKSVQPRREATLKSDLTVSGRRLTTTLWTKRLRPQSLEDLTNPQSQLLREFRKTRSPTPRLARGFWGHGDESDSPPPES